MFFRAGVHAHSLTKKQEFFVLLWDAQKKYSGLLCPHLSLWKKFFFFGLLASFPFSIDDVRVDVRLFHQRERGSNPRRVNLHHTNKILNRLNIQLVGRLDRVWGVFFSRKKNFPLPPPPAFFSFPTDKKKCLFFDWPFFFFRKKFYANLTVRWGFPPPPSMTPRGFEPPPLRWKKSHIDANIDWKWEWREETKKIFSHKDKCGHNNPLSFFTVLFFDSFMQDAKRKKIAYLHRT
jgi:hypothetical protein